MAKQEALSVDFDSLTDEDRQFLLEAAYERYADGNSLIGSVESCRTVVDQLIVAGVDEIACFVDFGVNREYVQKSFPKLADLAALFRPA
jgi:hypothetical protein